MIQFDIIGCSAVPGMVNLHDLFSDFFIFRCFLFLGVFPNVLFLRCSVCPGSLSLICSKKDQDQDQDQEQTRKPGKTGTPEHRKPGNQENQKQEKPGTNRNNSKKSQKTTNKSGKMENPGKFRIGTRKNQEKEDKIKKIREKG